MHIFFSVGEPSGDQHAAPLIRALRRRGDVRVSGFGGPEMERAGCSLLYPLTGLAVMGIFQVIPLIRQFFRLVRQADEYFARNKPDVVVLIDFPGFNWHVARAAKKHGIPVVYYLPPQMWAWAGWRIHKMRRLVDLVLSGLPFETDWYARKGMPVLYVGHPFFDEVAEHPLDESFCREWKAGSGPTIAVLPGSRTQEVKGCWPIFQRAIEQLSQRFPQARFLVANYRESQRDFCRRELAAARLDALPITFFVGRTPEVVSLADCAMMVSGSVSLELLARKTPAVVTYRCGWLTYLIGRAMVRIRYMSLPNLMAGKELMPEHLCVTNPDAAVAHVVNHLERWLANPAELPRLRAEFDTLHREIGATGATDRVASLLWDRYGVAREQKAAA